MSDRLRLQMLVLQEKIGGAGGKALWDIVVVFG